MREIAKLDIEEKGQTIRLSGDWTAFGIADLSSDLSKIAWPETTSLVLDMHDVSRLDSAGAWLLVTIKKERSENGVEVQFRGISAEQANLLELIEKRIAEYPTEVTPETELGITEKIGLITLTKIDRLISLIAFVGESTVVALRCMLMPHRIRWRILLNNLQQIGVNALPIIGLLSFLLGVVIAYQGGAPLRQYGANIFIVDLVNLTMLRELSPLMAAIIVAGRSGSAFTAQIGTMIVSQEVDAMRAIGIHPTELLVIPKLFALLIALPLLTVYADIMGVFGGMVMAATMLGVSFTEFISRTPESVSLTSFWLGVGKAPVFAIIIAIVGCFQGFRVSGGADSVGKNTTMSVVQAIFLIIVTDAMFSVAFSWLGI